MRFQTILFDLDGTLTDPFEGITGCVRYALGRFGIDASPEALTSFIGPPLQDSFMREYGFSAADAGRAAAFYRERFEREGWRQNRVIPGIPELLASLQQGGARLVVATTKPAHFSVKILREFHLYDYFDAVVGSNPDGSGGEKDVIVARALQGAVGKAAMVGDRKYDVWGAKANGIFPIGVSYGYAPPGELQRAGAAFVAPDVEALSAFLLARDEGEK